MTRLKWIALTTLALTLFSTIWFFFFRSGEDTPLYSVEFIETGYEDSFQLFPSVLTDSGHILFGLIKRSDASQTFKKGIIWSKNGIVEICPDCAAVSPTDMNENREVIGRFYPEGTEEESHPFFWTPEKGLVDLYQDLEVRLAIPGNLALVAINNHGRVLIQTHNETRPHYAGVQMSFSDQFSLGYIVDLISKPVVVESLPAGRMYVDLNDDNEVVGFNEE
ncbi:MAG: hypothetical protein KC978_24130, partial [Candidatus Omnitrophica bacterium]|nr:hypothetical protein [Candidatus Omnitrophota bacterium]